MKIPFFSNNGNGTGTSKEHRSRKARNKRNLECLEIPESFHESRKNLKEVCDSLTFPSKDDQEPIAS